MFEAEAEAEMKASRLRPRPNRGGRGQNLFPRGHFGLEDLTLLLLANCASGSHGSTVNKNTFVSFLETGVTITGKCYTTA